MNRTQMTKEEAIAFIRKARTARTEREAVEDKERKERELFLTRAFRPLLDLWDTVKDLPASESKAIAGRNHEGSPTLDTCMFTRGPYHLKLHSGFTAEALLLDGDQLWIAVNRGEDEEWMPRHVIDIPPGVDEALQALAEEISRHVILPKKNTL